MGLNIQKNRRNDLLARKGESTKKGFNARSSPFLVRFLFLFSLLPSIQSKPRHTHNDIQTPLVRLGVLEGPHAVALDVPERTRRRVHAALADVGGGAVRRGGLVDQALLDDGAVDGEAVGRGGGRVGRRGGGDEGFENGVLSIRG